MMRRGIGTWMTLVVCAALILGALGFLTQSLLRMENERLRGEARADREEKVRQALVQMDGLATPFLIEENQRSGEEFRTRILVREDHQWVRVRFEFGGGQAMTCPASAEDSLRLGQLLGEEYSGLKGFELLCAPVRSPDVGEELQKAKASWDANGDRRENRRNEDVYQNSFNSFSQVKRAVTVENTLNQVVERGEGPAGVQARGKFESKWLEDDLFLIRTVGEGSSQRYQGVWLDSRALSESLLAEARAFVAEAKLRPSEAGAIGQYTLVSLPWRLDLPPSAVVGVGMTPLRVSLLVGWIAVLVAVLALAGLIRGVMAISERRADFVASVTHELRTPLTSFRLYSGMLADGMVTDESARRDYLFTMQQEADRLHHLVENVLAYSRIERGGASIRKERTTLAEMVSRCEDRLRERVEREDASLILTLENGDFETETDVTGVEQILFNLVDNACKYGLGETGERVIRLETRVREGRGEFLVCDRGPGVRFAERRRLFRPFHKSAEAAAGSKPGVGLGLSLCRRLARALGGDLSLERSGEGACFRLSLE
ncbi:MAG: HAMP domain-containing sensor histidine kinase [Verrucomicrobiota bacterium JB023]|nr:HAMP domain-containing sensor histidine kinase [Verrucomicrobiota bacterium JB023]